MYVPMLSPARTRPIDGGFFFWSLGVEEEEEEESTKDIHTYMYVCMPRFVCLL